MQQTAALLGREEEEVYAVSAFSHFATPHTANDATRLQRVTSFPSCGWMTSRSFLQETLPKWPSANVVGVVTPNHQLTFAWLYQFIRRCL